MQIGQLAEVSWEHRRAGKPEVPELGQLSWTWGRFQRKQGAMWPRGSQHVLPQPRGLSGVSPSPVGWQEGAKETAPRLGQARGTAEPAEASTEVIAGHPSYLGFKGELGPG